MGGGAHFVVDIVGLGSVGVGGTADGLGAEIAAQWFPVSFVSFRLGGGAMGGTVPQAEATTLYLLGMAGVALHPLRARPGRPLGMAVRVDYVAMRQSMSQFAADIAPSGYESWLSGMDAFVEGDWLFASDVEFVLGLGMADVFDPTYVDVPGVPRITIPPVRALAELGFRLRF